MILDKLEDVRDRIAAAAKKADRKPEEVELIAVTKKASVEDIRVLVREGGLRQLGENRVQDAIKRREALGEDAQGVRWRFIGHLQKNKIRNALDMFDTLDSIDSLRLAEAVQRHLETQGRRLPVLIQVNQTGKDSQSGLPPGSLEDFLREMRKFPNLMPSGLMGIAPFVDPIEETRPFFREMKALFDLHFPEPFAGGEGPYLSMGMSRDYEVAVEEGANLVRVGSALFEA